MEFKQSERGFLVEDVITTNREIVAASNSFLKFSDEPMKGVFLVAINDEGKFEIQPMPLEEDDRRDMQLATLAAKTMVYEVDSVEAAFIITPCDFSRRDAKTDEEQERGSALLVVFFFKDVCISFINRFDGEERHIEEAEMIAEEDESPPMASFAMGAIKTKKGKIIAPNESKVAS